MAAGADVPLLHIRMLGPFQARLGDREIPRDAWRNRAARRLLLRLAGAHRATIRREEAMDLLWPEQDPASAANSLKATVYLLRRMLDPHGTAAARGRYVVHDRQIVGLNTDHLAPLDCDRFERVAAEARSGDVASLIRAAGLYTGAFLEDDPYEDWAIPRRTQMADRYQRLLLDLAAAQRQRTPAEALATLQRLLEADPCHEEAARQVMHIHQTPGAPIAASCRGRPSGQALVHCAHGVEGRCCPRVGPLRSNPLSVTALRHTT